MLKQTGIFARIDANALEGISLESILNFFFFGKEKMYLIF